MGTEEVPMPYPPGAVERAMKVEEVIVRVLAGKLTWPQAADILGRTPRSIRRLRWKFEHFGYDGLFDRRRQTPSPKRVPVAEVQRVLTLYRERYPGFNVRHSISSPGASTASASASVEMPRLPRSVVESCLITLAAVRTASWSWRRRASGSALAPWAAPANRTVAAL